MKAAIHRTYGPPSVLHVEETDTPVPGDNEVLVRVRATTVNRTDCANLTAKPFIMRFTQGFLTPRNEIPGTDVAGEIVELGAQVKDFRIRDRVFTFRDGGIRTQAEYVVLPADHLLMKIPDNISFEQAAASLEGAHYAYSFLHKVDIQPGQRILINGATGAIGSATLQFARTHDVHLTATCRGAHADLVRSLGADEVIDYTTEDFTRSGRQPFDFVFDTVGKSTLGACKPILKPGGTYISSELGPGAQNPFFALFPAVTKPHKVEFPIPYSRDKTFPYLLAHLSAGTFQPLIDRQFPLEEIAEAYRYVMSGEKVGNVVVG